MQTDLNCTSTPAGIVAAAERIRGLCSVVTKIARADMQARLESHGSGISAIEHGVLRHLTAGISSMAEISRLMGVAPSTLVYVVDGLVEKKLIKRGKDPADRRREPLSLEKKAAELFKRIPTMDAGSVLVKSLQGMKDSQRRELLRLLEEFVAGMPGTRRMLPHSEAVDEQAAGSWSEQPARKSEARRPKP